MPCAGSGSGSARCSPEARSDGRRSERPRPGRAARSRLPRRPPRPRTRRHGRSTRAEVDLFKPLTILLGRNGSGLSAVLSSMRDGDEERQAALRRITEVIRQIPEEPFAEIGFVETPLGVFGLLIGSAANGRDEVADRPGEHIERPPEAPCVAGNRPHYARPAHRPAGALFRRWYDACTDVLARTHLRTALSKESVAPAVG